MIREHNESRDDIIRIPITARRASCSSLGACPSMPDGLPELGPVPERIVAVVVAVVVIDTVIVAVHVHGNDTVGVIGPLDDQGSIIFVSMATTRSRRVAPTA